jgi:A/G-specific adenine glycosylase
VCTKTPQCLKCPIKSSCKGFAEGIAQELPIKSKKISAVDLFREVALIECEGKFLIRKCPKGEIMHDLYQFPFSEMAKRECDSKAQVFWIRKNFDLSVSLVDSMPVVKHGFTKYRVTLYPALYTCKELKIVPDYQWVEKDLLSTLPFNSGHRRILQSLQ